MSRLYQQPKIPLKDGYSRLVSQSDQVWQILTTLKNSNKLRKNNQRKNAYLIFAERQSIVKKLSSHKKQDLECAKALVERQIEDGRILVAILASFGVAMSYLFEGTQLRTTLLIYFACLGIFTWLDVSRKNYFVSLLKQALASTNY